MAQRTWFTTEQVEMMHTDVEGDGKQIISRPATAADKSDYAAQYADFKNPTPGVAGQPGLAAQNSGVSGTTTRDLQAAQNQPGQQPSNAPAGSTGQPR